MKKEKVLRIAMAQINTCVGDFQGNTQKILSAIDQARANSCDIISFPELAVCGYPPEDLLFKKSFIEENLKRLGEIRARTNDILAIVGFADKQAGQLFNSAALLANKKLLDVYHKIHLPNYGVFDEKRYFQSGKDFVLYEVSGFFFGVNICEDIWISDGVINAQVKSGASLILTINASPYHMGKIHLRRRILEKQARENKVFIIYTNLVGAQDELVFDGQSMCVSDRGKVLALASAFKEDLHIVDIPIKKLAQKKKSKRIQIVPVNIQTQKEIPSIHPPEHISRLGLLDEVWQALVLGTQDYVRKNGFKKTVLGMSGGIDSSLVAVIAAEALGKENVLGVIMPSQFNSPNSYEDAVTLADNLGIEYKVIPIKEIFEHYLIALRPHFLESPWNVAEENIQARIRGNILMGLSNKFGWLVLTTGNKSEMGVGYATLYGDMAGGFAVIKDVPKTLVYALSEFYNRKKGQMVIPKRVLVKAPTAELKKNQKDLDTLPLYEVLDSILKYYVEEDLSISEILKKGFNKEEVLKAVQMVDKSEYKRRQAPPGIKITPRAFGRDRRMPITNRFSEKM
jgi:NAD+ synthase (glutamine-hydrolysing)